MGILILATLPVAPINTLVFCDITSVKILRENNRSIYYIRKINFLMFYVLTWGFFFGGLKNFFSIRIVVLYVIL